jgi:hypothetical protein
MQLWWQPKSVEKNLKRKTQKGNLSFEPFCLRLVEKDGRQCSICHWTKRCAGCLIVPNEENVG